MSFKTTAGISLDALCLPLQAIFAWISHRKQNVLENKEEGIYWLI